MQEHRSRHPHTRRALRVLTAFLVSTLGGCSYLRDVVLVNGCDCDLNVTVRSPDGYVTQYSDIPSQGVRVLRQAVSDSAAGEVIFQCEGGGRKWDVRRSLRELGQQRFTVAVFAPSSAGAPQR